MPLFAQRDSIDTKRDLDLVLGLRVRPLASDMIALEPRMVFDGAGAATAAAVKDIINSDASSAGSHETGGDMLAEAGKLAAAMQPVDAAERDRAGAEKTGVPDSAPQARAPGREIVFIDARVTDPEAFTQAAAKGSLVVSIGADEDGFAVIAKVLAEQGGDVTAIHIVGHGGAARADLGSSHLDAGTIAQQTDLLHSWQAYLSADADILFYGCDVAAGAQGQALISAIASATGADVAASADAVGRTANGLDWSLEKTTGDIEAKILAPDVYASELGVPTITAINGKVGVSTSAAPQFSGSADVGASVTLNVDGVDYTTDKDGALILANSGGKWSATLAGSLSEGVHTIVARTSSGLSNSFYVYVDTNASTPVSVNYFDAHNVVATSRLLTTATPKSALSIGGPLVLGAEGVSYKFWRAGQQATAVTGDAFGVTNWSATLDVSTRGLYFLELTNDTTKTVYAIQVGASLAAPTMNAQAFKTANPQLSGVVPDGATVQLRIDGAETLVDAIVVGTQWSYSSDFAVNTKHDVEVIATVGNDESTSRFFVVVDNIAPTLTAINVDRGLPNGTASFEIVFGEAMDPAFVTSNAFTLTAPGFSATTPTVEQLDSAGLRWRVSYERLAEATWTFKVSGALKDLAGNTLGASTLQGTVTVINPLITLVVMSPDTPAVDAVVFQNNVSAKIPDATPAFTIETSANASLVVSDVVDGPATVGTLGLVSSDAAKKVWRWQAPASGTKFYLKATEGAAVTRFVLDYVVDTVAPTFVSAASAMPATPDSLDTNRIDFKLTFSEAVKGLTSAMFALLDGNDQPVSAMITPLGDGSNPANRYNLADTWIVSAVWSEHLHYLGDVKLKFLGGSFKDVAGNVGVLPERTVVHTITQPVHAFVSSQGSLVDMGYSDQASVRTNALQPDFRFEFTYAVSEVNVYGSGGSKLGTANAVDASRKIWSWSASESPPEGEVWIRVEAKTLPTSNPTSQTFGFIVDRHSPVVTLDAGSEPQHPAISGTVDDDAARVDVYLKEGTSETLLGSATSFETIAGTTKKSWNLPPSASAWTDGDHTLVVRAKDTAGNEGATTLTMRVDAVPPTVTMTQSRLGTGDYRINLSFSEAVTGLSASSLVAVGGTLTGFTLDLSGMNATVTLVTADDFLGQASVQVSGRVTDRAGNALVDDGKIVAFTISELKPVVAPTLTTPASGVTSGLRSYSGTGPANGKVNVFLGDALIARASVNEFGNWSLNIDLSLRSEGVHVLKFVSVNSKNIASTGFVTDSILIDKTAPTVTLDSAFVRDTFAGTVAADTSTLVAYDVTASTMSPLGGLSLVGGSTNKSWSVSTASLLAGLHTIKTVATDAAGNQKEQYFEVLVDRTVPFVAGGFVTKQASGDYLVTIAFNEKIKEGTFALSQLSVLPPESGTWVDGSINYLASAVTALFRPTSAATGIVNVRVAAGATTDLAGNALKVDQRADVNVISFKLGTAGTQAAKFGYLNNLVTPNLQFRGISYDTPVVTNDNQFGQALTIGAGSSASTYVGASTTALPYVTITGEETVWVKTVDANNITIWTAFQCKLDRTAPAVVAVERLDGAAANGSSVRFRVYFSDNVVDAGDAIALSGLSGAVVSSASAVMTTPGAFRNPGATTPVTPAKDASSVWEITVSGYDASASGALTLGFKSTSAAQDAAFNNLAPSTLSSSYTIDRQPPAIKPGSLVATALGDGTYRIDVEFTESISGFDLVLSNASAGQVINKVTNGARASAIFMPVVSFAGSVDIRVVDSVVDAAQNMLAANAEKATITASALAVQAIERATGSHYAAGSSVTFNVTFSQAVSGLTGSEFEALDSRGERVGSLSAVADPAGGSATLSTKWKITVAYGAQFDGSLALHLAAGATIDSRTVDGADKTADYVIDQKAPVLSKIERSTASQFVSATSVTYKVTFSEDLPNVLSSNFSVTSNGQLLAARISVAQDPRAGASVWLVSVSDFAAGFAGEVTLALAPAGALSNLVDKAGTRVAASDLSASYTIDRQPPAIKPGSLVATALGDGTYKIDVEFTENISGFDLALSNASAGQVISKVTNGARASAIFVPGASFAGSVDIRVVDSVVDAAQNRLAANGEKATITAPALAVQAIERATGSHYAAGSSVTFNVTFSQAVAGLTGSEFEAVDSKGARVGTLSAVADPAGGSATLSTKWKITVAYNAQFDGGLALHLAAGATIGSRTVDGADKTADYVIDQKAPVLSKIERSTPSQFVSAASVTYKVTFSEDLPNVLSSNFIVTSDGKRLAAGISVTQDATAGASVWLVSVDDFAAGFADEVTLALAPAGALSNLVDKAGTRISASDLSASYTIDPQGGTLSFDGGPDVKSARPVLSGSAGANVTRIQIHALRDGGSEVSLGEAALSGTGEARYWSLTPTFDLPDGTYLIRADATSRSGDRFSVTSNLVVDTSPPTIVFLRIDDSSAQAGKTALTPLASPTFEGAGAEGAVLSYKLRARGLEAPASFTETDVSVSDGAWRLALADALEDGAYEITFLLTDEAGRSATATCGFIVDTHAPNLPETATVELRVNENARGERVGSVAASDLTAVSYAIVSGGEDFEVDAVGMLKTSMKARLDYETAPSRQVTIRATDAVGHKSERTYQVSLNDLIENAPAVPAPPFGSISETERPSLNPRASEGKQIAPPSLELASPEMSVSGDAAGEAGRTTGSATAAPFAVIAGGRVWSSFTVPTSVGATSGDVTGSTPVERTGDASASSAASVKSPSLASSLQFSAIDRGAVLEVRISAPALDSAITQKLGNNVRIIGGDESVSQVGSSIFVKRGQNRVTFMVEVIDEDNGRVLLPVTVNPSTGEIVVGPGPRGASPSSAPSFAELLRREADPQIESLIAAVLAIPPTAMDVSVFAMRG